jgi:uncharacterized membrane protein YccC
MFVSMALTTGMNVPHGIWASVTLLVVIGGLQHHGNIRKKAAERALGTLIGAAVGLACIALQQAIGWSWLTFAVMSLFAGVFAYSAIGRAGYVALLAAITMCIVAGHGDNNMSVGLWRSANVLFGIVIALAFSFALPLYATYAWRYRLADNFRLCARLVAATNGQLDQEARRQAFATLGDRLVQLRSLMPSVAKEIDAPLGWLESLQREHRVLIGALDLLLDVRAERAPMAGNASLRAVSLAAGSGLEGDVRYLRDLLIALSRALRVGRTTHLAALTRPGANLNESATAQDTGGEDAAQRNAAQRGAAQRNAAQCSGTSPTDRSSDLIEQIIARVERIRSMVLAQEARWNIEGRIAPPKGDTHFSAAP